MKAIHMTAVRIADRIGAEEPVRSEFIRLYQSFKKESAAVLSVNPAATGNAEDDIEAKIYSDFEKREDPFSKEGVLQKVPCYPFPVADTVYVRRGKRIQCP